MLLQHDFIASNNNFASGSLWWNLIQFPMCFTGKGSRLCLQFQHSLIGSIQAYCWAKQALQHHCELWSVAQPVPRAHNHQTCVEDTSYIKMKMISGVQLILTKFLWHWLIAGSVKSLISLPCFMSHASIPAEVREARGLTEDLIRVSVSLHWTCTEI